MTDGRIVDRALTRLAALDPPLHPRFTECIGGGENNLVYLVDGDLIIRVARYGLGSARFQQEAQLLRAAGHHLPVPIPSPLHVDAAEWGAMMTYRMLRGTPLTAIAAPDLLDVAAAGVSGFLRALHAVPLDALPAHLRDEDPRVWWQELYDRVHEFLLPRMGLRSAGETTDQFETFLTGPRPPRYALVHGDLGSEHILLDPDSGAVTGVIDWESAHVDDPAVDYAAISTAGPAFVERLLAIDAEFAAAQSRSTFYRSTFGLQAWLHALDHGTAEEQLEFTTRYRE